MPNLTEPAKLLLLISLLAKDRIITNNGKSFLKEMILRRDPRLLPLIEKFETKEATDVTFLEQLHELISSEAHAMYDDLFSDTNLEVGKALSKSERELKNLTEDKSLIYGEVEFESFYRVLRKINAEPGKVFYDLGSGTGKAVFVARLTQDFEKCIGVEVLHSLHIQAETIVARFENSYKDSLALGQSHYVQVFEGSLLDFDWSDGDVVFANSTCFGDELMAGLSQQAEKLKPGSIVVTFTKGLTSTAFELLERKRYRMSWGPATVFIHRRLNADGRPVGPAKLNLLPSDNVTYDDEVSQYRQQSPRSNSDDEDEDDEDEDSNYQSDDIDMGIREFNQDNDEEDEDEENEEDDEDEDLGGDDEEDDDEEEEDNEDVSAHESDGEDDDDDDDDKEQQDNVIASNQSPRSPAKHFHSQSPAAKLTSPGNAIFQRSPLKSSPFQSSPVRSTPQKPPSVSQVPPNVVADFSMLNSPQDTALLMRRRAAKQAQKHECVDSDGDDQE